MSSENKSAKGPIIAGTVIGAILLTPIFGAASQAIKNANAPDTSNVTLSAEDTFGMDGYNWLKDQGYGNVGGIEGAKSGQYDSHITQVQVDLKNGTETFLTSEPGTLGRELVTVSGQPGDPGKLGTSKNFKIIKIAPAKDTLLGI